MPRHIPIPTVTKHTELTDKEVGGVIDHADASVSDAKLASGVGLGDGQICKLPVAVANKFLKRGASAWEAGDVPSSWADFFYWLTLFESLDGMTSAVGGTGMITLHGEYVELVTGSTINSYAQLQKIVVVGGGLLCLSWGLEQRLRVNPVIWEATNQVIWLVRGNFNELGHIGFKVVNNILYGTVGNDTVETTLGLGTIEAGGSPILEAVFKPAVECRFYVNGEDRGAITSNLPTEETGDADFLMTIRIGNTAAEDKEITLSSWEVYAVPRLT